jgi:signal transduction histidine kinase
MTAADSLELLAEIERELVSELDRDRLLHLIMDRAGRLFDARGAIYLLQGDQLVPLARTDENVLTEPIAMGTGVTGICAETRKGLLVNDYTCWPDALSSYAADGVDRTIAQPLVAHGDLLGVICVSRGRGKREFTADDLERLGRVALQAALALRNAMLYEQSEQRRRHAEEFARIARLLNERLDVVTVCQRITETVMTLLPVAFSTITLLEQDGSLRLIASDGTNVAGARDTILPRGFGVTGRAVQEGVAVWSSDVASDPRLRYPDDFRSRLLDSGQRALLATPLRPGGRIIGALTVGDRTVREFTAAEIALVQAFADVAAVALENARLYEEAERGRREAVKLADVARVTAETLGTSAVAGHVAESLVALFDAVVAGVGQLAHDGSLVILASRGSHRSLFEEGRVVPPGTGILEQAVREGRLCWSANLWRDPRVSEQRRRLAEDMGVRAALTVPLVVRGRTIGVLGMCFRERDVLSDRDTALAEVLADHAAIALDNAALFEEAQRKREEAEATRARLHATSVRLLEVQEAERRQLSRELHDEVGQALTAVRINLQMLGMIPGLADAGSRLDDSVALVDRILQAIRQLSLDLRPPLLDDLGLAAALRWYVEEHAGRANLTGEVIAEAAIDALPPELATTCFRVVQEAVNNVLRHAGARHVKVEARRAAGGIELIVGDDGKGFDVAAARQRAVGGASLGLLGLEERVNLAGGRLAIRSAPGHGTEVRAWVPVPPRVTEHAP